MVRFLPYDQSDEESMNIVLQHIDFAIQYGEDLEFKEPKVILIIDFWYQFAPALSGLLHTPSNSLNFVLAAVLTWAFLGVLRDSHLRSTSSISFLLLRLWYY